MDPKGRLKHVYIANGCEDDKLFLILDSKKKKEKKETTIGAERAEQQNVTCLRICSFSMRADINFLMHATSVRTHVHVTYAKASEG